MEIGKGYTIEIDTIDIKEAINNVSLMFYIKLIYKIIRNIKRTLNARITFHCLVSLFVNLNKFNFNNFELSFESVVSSRFPNSSIILKCIKILNLWCDEYVLFESMLDLGWIYRLTQIVHQFLRLFAD